MVKNGSYLKEQFVDVYPARGATTHPLMRGVFVTKKKTIERGDVGKGGGMTGLPPKEKLEERLKQPKNEWKIDDESPNMEVLNKRAVTVLMASKKIADMREGHGALAITFGGSRFIPGTGGKRGPRTGIPVDGRGTKAGAGGAPMGRVLHVLSHFGRQQTKEDAFALQNLLLNFLIEGRDFMPYRRK